jgi:hypothetical protein
MNRRDPVPPLMAYIPSFTRWLGSSSFANPKSNILTKKGRSRKVVSEFCERCAFSATLWGIASIWATNFAPRPSKSKPTLSGFKSRKIISNLCRWRRAEAIYERRKCVCEAAQMSHSYSMKSTCYSHLARPSAVAARVL